MGNVVGNEGIYTGNLRVNDFEGSTWENVVAKWRELHGKSGKWE